MGDEQSMTVNMAEYSVKDGHCYFCRLHGVKTPANFFLRKQFSDLGLLQVGCCSDCVTVQGPQSQGITLLCRK